MRWEYQIVRATYYEFPYWLRNEWRTGNGRPSFIDVPHEDDTTRHRAGKDKLALWRDAKWAELGLDPKVDWHKISDARLMQDPQRKYLRLEDNVLNEYGQDGWELVTAYPDRIPYGGDVAHSEFPTIVYVLKRLSSVESSA